MLAATLANAQSVEDVTSQRSENIDQSRLAVTQSAHAISAESQLPCLDSSPSCVEQLTTQAVNNSLELRVIDEAVKLSKRRGWTDYISLNALNPLTQMLQLTRNIAGGGDVQQRKLSIKQLELRRHELTTQLRAEVSGLLTRIEADERKRSQAQTLFDAQRAMVAVMEVGYRSGDGSTERMLPIWEKLDFFRDEVEAAKADRAAATQKLLLLIRPSGNERAQR